MRHTGKTPNGADLLKTLVELLADQYGVKITYEIEVTKKDETEKEKSA